MRSKLSMSCLAIVIGFVVAATLSASANESHDSTGVVYRRGSSSSATSTSSTGASYNSHEVDQPYWVSRNEDGPICMMRTDDDETIQVPDDETADRCPPLLHNHKNLASQEFHSKSVLKLTHDKKLAAINRTVGSKTFADFDTCGKYMADSLVETVRSGHAGFKSEKDIKSVGSIVFLACVTMRHLGPDSLSAKKLQNLTDGYFIDAVANAYGDDYVDNLPAE